MPCGIVLREVLLDIKFVIEEERTMVANKLYHAVCIVAMVLDFSGSDF